MSKGATVHLIRLDKGTEIVSVQDLEEKYPGITKQLKRGDLVEDLNESGYRSDGVFMVDFESDGLETRPIIIKLSDDFDPYGSPAITMAAISQFPIDYWDIDRMVANETYEKIEQKYRTAYPGGFGNNWHCSENQAFVAFYPDHFTLTESNLTLKEDDQEYLIYLFDYPKGSEGSEGSEEKYMVVASELPEEVPWCVHGLSEYALKVRPGLQRLMQDNNIKRENVVVCADIDWID